jgi:hypothetical protein
LAFSSLKYTYVGKKKISWQINGDPDQKHCFFPFKIADLRFADWNSYELWGIAIAERAQVFADLRFAGYKNVRAHLC